MKNATSNCRVTGALGISFEKVPTMQCISSLTVQGIREKECPVMSSDVLVDNGLARVKWPMTVILERQELS